MFWEKLLRYCGTKAVRRNRNVGGHYRTDNKIDKGANTNYNSNMTTDNKIDKGANTNYNSNMTNYNSENKNASKAHSKTLVPYCLSNLVSSKKIAFTLAEVLITLGIIGIVAAMTIPTLVSDITNKGFVEKLKKNYVLIQNVTKMVIAENGDPAYWQWSEYNSPNFDANDNIAEMYKKHLKVTDTCPPSSDDRLSAKCVLTRRSDYSYLNGSNENVGDYAGSGYRVFYCNYIFMLSDGTTLGLRFNSGRCGKFWGAPDLTFTIDVNGKAGPNTIGRDIFYVYMNKSDHGQVKPYTNENFFGIIDNTNTCDINSTGQSCAYRVLTEGKMNY